MPISRSLASGKVRQIDKIIEQKCGTVEHLTSIARMQNQEMPEKITIQHAEDHKCLICDAKTAYFFSKQFPTYPGSPFPDDLSVDYWKCGHCGFVVSKTHQEMTTEQWSQLNLSCHHHFEQNMETQATNQPPYAEQALALTMLSKNDVINISDTLDYAAGYGTLSRFLAKYLNSKINIYDRYVCSDDKGLQYVSDEKLGKHQLVINSAMFEHVLDRHALDEVNNLVSDDGVLMLHTVICERIPKDPNWFYMTPIVHTAFHTNKSMSILMEQWGYAASVYSPQAKSWFLFKRQYAQLNELEALVDNINREVQSKHFHYKPGFVDYWKGF